MERQQINEIVHVSKTLSLTCNQALFLLAYLVDVFSIDLPGEELLDLIQRGYLKGNRVTADGIERVQQALLGIEPKIEEEVKLNSQYPILTRETGQLVKVLAKHFHRGQLTPKEVEHLGAYTKNPMVIPFLFMFLQMFPTADTAKNVAWAEHFGENGSGVTLRKVSRGTARKFQEIWKKKDIGLFLLGTYLCIKQSYNKDSDKYFVMKIENYLAECDYWYQQAEDMLTRGALEAMTKPNIKPGVRENNNTTVI